MTHGVFSAESGPVLAASALERVVLLDTIARPLPDGIPRERIQRLDCAPLLAAAISRLHTEGSLLELST